MNELILRFIENLGGFGLMSVVLMAFVHRLLPEISNGMNGIRQDLSSLNQTIARQTAVLMMLVMRDKPSGSSDALQTVSERKEN